MTTPARHEHINVLPRWVRPVIASMAFLLAIGFGVVTWLIEQRDQSVKERQQLACQVERLGGQPVGGVRCPPPRKTKATPAPTSTVTLSPGTHTTVLVVPSGGSTVVRPAPQRSASASSTPTRSPTAKPTRSASPSPSNCTHVDGIASVCLTPPPLLFEMGTVWLWL